MPEAKPERRPRDAAATRQAILDAARKCFSNDSYERIGLREVAEGAGVTAALVIRYFGSKEKLFVEVVGPGPGIDELLEGDRAQLGERLARHVFTGCPSPEANFDPLLVLLRSAPNPEAAKLLREAIHNEFIRPLAEWLGGEDALVRAGLITSQLLGIAVMRDIIGYGPLATANVELLVRAVAPTMQAHVDPAPPAASAHQ